MPTPALLLATLATLALPTDPRRFWDTGMRATASPPALERTAAAPAALATWASAQAQASISAHMCAYQRM